MYILRNGESLIGEEGEIVSGGYGLAIDYIGEPELTQRQFVYHPKLGRLYKTGDRGILTQDGYIRILGRMDNQVKVNGFRIELEEIEKVLNNMEQVNQSVVCVLKEEQGDRLAAGVTLSENWDIDVELLKQEIGKYLPSYAIPSDIYKLEKLPLSLNNKVDRRQFLNDIQERME